MQRVDLCKHSQPWWNGALEPADSHCVNVTVGAAPFEHVDCMGNR
jgi:hypothetical protein